MQSFELVGLRTYCKDGKIYSYGDILQLDRIYINYADDKHQADENQGEQSNRMDNK